ncbi:MAG: type I glyceraldehyde-3-phosphate dehydrogenase [Candidatus Doudnabacteria bacterium]|nr:type I glyceraldehyde-3-phosphate dehydrogenase [Candidatus Doudnabacteria bacterium]
MLRKIKVGINGFGRIGRAAFKIASAKSNMEVVAINDVMDAETAAYLLKFDTIYGRYDRQVVYEGSNLIVDRRKIPLTAQKEPALIPWKNFKVDVVLECSGRFTKDGLARGHLTGGARKVIVSAPAKGGEVGTFLLGVNEESYRGEDVISNASCTTNCVATVVKVLKEKFGIVKGMMTTVHAITAEQNLVDGPVPALHKDLRRARAAASNLVPTSSGSATDTAKVIKGLEGSFDAFAIRIPVAIGSVSDFTVLVKKKTTVEQVNHAFLEYARKNPKILAVTNEPIVSSDIIGDSHSAIVDLSLTKVIGGDLVKVLAWYDNEWGYSNRLVEEIEMVMK